MNLLYCGDSKMQQGILLSILSFMKNISQPLKVYSKLFTDKIPKAVSKNSILLSFFRHNYHGPISQPTLLPTVCCVYMPI